MTRSHLPNRRETVTERVEVRGQAYLVSVGPVPGPVREVFAKGPKGDVMALVDDGLILASVLLQSGYRLADLVGMVERGDDGEPASLTGCLLAAALKLEEEMNYAKSS